MTQWYAYRLAVVCLAGCLVPSTARSQNDSQRLIILDLAAAPSNSSLANRIYSLTLGDITDSAAKGLVSRVHTEGCANDATAGALLSRMRKVNATLTAASSTRWISGKGDSVWIIVFHPGTMQPQLSINEEARSSRLAKDVETLIQLAQKISGSMMSIAEAAHPQCSFRRYSLTRVRATLKVTALLKDAPVVRNQSATTEENPATLTVSQITGPAEHFFLSANAALTSVRQVKYNSDNHSFEPGKKPTGFLIGVNYAFGDLFQQEEASGGFTFLKSIYLGLLIEGSKKPFNQVAAIAGLRRNLGALEKWISLETVSPYAGIVWAQDDTGTVDAVTSKFGRGKAFWGLSLNLDKALAWVGGGTTTAASPAVR
jgi:hypothetical protein